MSVLLVLLLVVAVGLIVTGLALRIFEADVLQARLAQFSQRPRTLQEMELQQPFSERVLRPLIAQLAVLTERFSRRRDPRRRERAATTLQRRLSLAGNPNRWTASDFLGVKVLAGIVVAAVVFLLLTLAGQPAIAFFGAFGGALIGFFVPELYLNQLIRQRQAEIQRVMPDALDLLCISVEAGLGFDGALSRLAQKTDNALTREFNRVLQEVRVGRPRRDALREVIARTEVADLSNFISAVIQAEQLGVSVTTVLEVQAEQMRTLRRQRAEEQAAQAPIKMLIPMALFIFPALCVVILGPLWPQLAGSLR